MEHIANFNLDKLQELDRAKRRPTTSRSRERVLLKVLCEEILEQDLASVDRKKDERPLNAFGGERGQTILVCLLIHPFVKI
jgi:hypothetical protein